MRNPPAPKRTLTNGSDNARVNTLSSPEKKARCGQGRLLEKLPYVRPMYDYADSVVFPNNMDWDTYLFRPGIKRLVLCENFDVRDHHLFELAQYPKFCETLEYLEAGCHRTGNGSGITDSGIDALTKRCPALKVLVLCSAILLTNEGLVSVFRNCPYLECLVITGNESKSGSLTDELLHYLRKHPTKNSLLRCLDLTNQRNFSPGINHLAMLVTMLRPGLEIHLGNTIRLKPLSAITEDLICNTVGGESRRIYAYGRETYTDKPCQDESMAIQHIPSHAEVVIPTSPGFDLHELLRVNPGKSLLDVLEDHVARGGAIEDFNGTVIHDAESEGGVTTTDFDNVESDDELDADTWSNHGSTTSAHFSGSTTPSAPSADLDSGSDTYEPPEWDQKFDIIDPERIKEIEDD